MLRKHGPKRKTDHPAVGAAALIFNTHWRRLSAPWAERSKELVERLSGETFSQRVSVRQSPNAHPAIRVGARRLAQYNGSELFGWKTSAPNLPNG
jgi:hypothetical protein